MKKTLIKLSVLLLSFSILTACSKNQFMDLSGFIYAFNRISEEEIEFEDVYSYKDGSEDVFEILFDEDESDVILKLVTENDRIKQIRIAIAKTDAKGNAVMPSAETVSDFIEIAENTLMAYCRYEKGEAESVLRDFGLYNIENYRKEGELSKNEDSFKFVYYSDSFVCNFVISNTFLLKTEATEKPQSKPAYGNTTNVRGETKPLPTFKR